MSDLACLASAIKMGIGVEEALGMSWSGLNALAKGYNELSSRTDKPVKTPEEAKFEAGLKAAERLAERMVKTGATRIDANLLKGI